MKRRAVSSRAGIYKRDWYTGKRLCEKGAEGSWVKGRKQVWKRRCLTDERVPIL